MVEALAVVAMAALWWMPTFIGLTDLQGRSAVPRVLVWKWTAILCVPVAGAVLYRTVGRRELDALVG